MKLLKIFLYVFLIFLGLYGLLLLIWNISYTSKIGESYPTLSRKTYFIFYQAVDVAEEYDYLNFDFYRNDSLIIEQKYFDSTDGEPQISDFKVRNYGGLYYVTYFDSTKVKIICDNNLSIIFPTDYGGVKEDSVSKLPKVKKLLTDKRLTLGRW